MEGLRLEEELAKQKKSQQEKHSNSFNRHSKDSGVLDIELIRLSDSSHRTSTSSNNNNNIGGGGDEVVGGGGVKDVTNVLQLPSYVNVLECKSGFDL